MRIHSPVLVDIEKDLDLVDARCPAILVLEALSQRGWKMKRPKQPHKPNDALNIRFIRDLFCTTLNVELGLRGEGALEWVRG